MICLHSNASSSGQWRGLMESLEGSHHVLAPDAYGAGKSPAWVARRTLRLQDELDLMEPVLAAAGDSFSLVGHSYGAAVALIAALRHPEKVTSLVVSEPTLFALVDAQSAAPNGVDGIRNVAKASIMDSTPATPRPRPAFSSTSGWGLAAGTRRLNGENLPLPMPSPAFPIGQMPCSMTPRPRLRSRRWTFLFCS